MRLDEPFKREFYEAECIRGNWSVRQLDRQIQSMLYERTALIEMESTKAQYAITEGISYNHIIQSFKPGEITPEKAHEIGFELSPMQKTGIQWQNISWRKRPGLEAIGSGIEKFAHKIARE